MIVDISPLRSLVSLTYLSLRSTRVSDLSPIADLPLTTLVLAGCEHLTAEAHDVVAALRERGCTVSGLDEAARPAKTTPTPTAKKTKAKPKSALAKEPPQRA